MDIFAFIALILSIGAYGISIYKVVDDRQAKKKVISNKGDNAMLFLRDFNKEGWKSGFRVDNPRSKFYYEQVDRLRNYRNEYPEDLRKIVDEFLDIVSRPMDHGIRNRSEKLTELEKEMRSEADIRLRK